MQENKLHQGVLLWQNEIAPMLKYCLNAAKEKDLRYLHLYDKEHVLPMNSLSATPCWPQPWKISAHLTNSQIHCTPASYCYSNQIVDFKVFFMVYF